jgi:alkanesulfonate monooxygenase SsuD/methylene tetrahydromethanopterin reductase-like flavin-dependent oxidoreductase (luciferase family)
VRLAEQMATLGCLGPGRLEVVLGAGYRKAEFEMAGVERSQRGKLVEECYEVCLKAFAGAPFTWRGREVLVTPVPPADGAPHLMIGGKTDIAARRAARLDAPFSPAKSDPELLQSYIDECARLGHAPRIEGLGAKPMGPGFVMISHDPEQTWAQIEPLARFDAATYASWQDDTARSDWFVSGAAELSDLRESGNYVVYTPEECIAQYRRHGSLTLHPLMGGIHPDLAWQSLHLFETEVLPAISH